MTETDRRNLEELDRWKREAELRKLQREQAGDAADFVRIPEEPKGSGAVAHTRRSIDAPVLTLAKERTKNDDRIPYDYMPVMHL